MLNKTPLLLLRLEPPFLGALHFQAFVAVDLIPGRETVLCFHTNLLRGSSYIKANIWSVIIYRWKRRVPDVTQNGGPIQHRLR